MIAELGERNETAQLLIARYQEHEDLEAVLEGDENSRLNRERRHIDDQIETLMQSNEDLRLLLAEETKNMSRADNTEA